MILVYCLIGSFHGVGEVYSSAQFSYLCLFLHYNSCQCIYVLANIDKEVVALVNLHKFSTVKIDLYDLE